MALALILNCTAAAGSLRGPVVHSGLAAPRSVSGVQTGKQEVGHSVSQSATKTRLLVAARSQLHPSGKDVR